MFRVQDFVPTEKQSSPWAITDMFRMFAGLSMSARIYEIVRITHDADYMLF